MCGAWAYCRHEAICTSSGTAADGSRRALAAPIPFVIYPSASRRVANIALDADDIGANDEVEVSYSTDRQYAKSDLASFHLTL